MCVEFGLSESRSAASGWHSDGNQTAGEVLSAGLHASDARAEGGAHELHA